MSTQILQSKCEMHKTTKQYKGNTKQIQNKYKTNTKTDVNRIGTILNQIITETKKKQIDIKIEAVIGIVLWCSLTWCTNVRDNISYKTSNTYESI